MRPALDEWLSSPDASINHNAASNAHHPGTTLWFTEGKAFQNWKESGSLLWIYGKRTFSFSLRLCSC